MAKEKNKSTAILLLVIAGALLFLVGSFTGQPIWKWPKQSTTTEPTTTTGLTAIQKQDVLNILKDKTELWARIYVEGNYYVLGKGQDIFIQGIGITLENVGNNGEIAINIDGVIWVLSPGRKENINTLNGNITIINLDTYKVIKHPY